MHRPVTIAGLLLLAVVALPAIAPAGDIARDSETDIRIGFAAPRDGFSAGDTTTATPERHRGRRGARGCSPLEAVGQARGQGFHRPSIADISRRSVVVEGHGRYGWGRMVFANMPGCPLIAR